MQVDSVISNTISQDIRLKGHQSIRFSPDGFSLLVSDASYKPVLLKQYVYDASVTEDKHPSECRRVLEELELLNFEGETVFIVDSPAFTLIPAQFYDPELDRKFLEKSSILSDSDLTYSRYIRNWNLYILFSVSREIEELKNQMEDTRIIHTSECLVSLSDQVQASDHQRGVVLAEVQPYTLALLVIQEDGIRLLNRYTLKDPSDFIYHTLNTIKQLELDRETIPVYLSGIVHDEHELFGLLGKYIRQVKITPYYLEELSRLKMLRYMLVSEGSKCV